MTKAIETLTPREMSDAGIPYEQQAAEIKRRIKALDDRDAAEHPNQWQCDCGDWLDDDVCIGDEPGDHCCYYIRAESRAAAAYEDAAYGLDD